MNPSLYLPSLQRKNFIESIVFLEKTYINRITPVFKNLEQEGKDVQEGHYTEIGKQFNPEYDDPGDFAEEAFFKGLNHFENTNLMKYNTRLLWITMLYQYWEQQLRKYLYKELTRFHSYTLKNGTVMTFKEFCPTGRITDFENIFNDLQFDVNSMGCWGVINEIRLLNNVIKHSEGRSADELRNLRPDFFVSQYFNEDPLERNLSTLNDITLNVSDMDFIHYADSIVDFWSTLPEYIPEKKSNIDDLFNF